MVDTLYSLFLARNGSDAPVRRFHLLYVDAGRLVRSMDLQELLNAFESDLHFRVALSARRRLFVHAGVVGLHGRAIIVPGRSMSGKTTLVAALVRAGATYYSDEFASLDVRGRVHPYPKPLGLRRADGESRELVAAGTLGAQIGGRPLPVGLVVLTEYRPGARWRPRAQTPAEGVMGLLSHTVLARARPRFALETLHQVALGATVLKGRRGEAEEVAGAVLERLESDEGSERRDE